MCVCLCENKDQFAPRIQSRLHRGRTNGFYIRHVMCQIHRSQTRVDVCEAVLKDRLYLFTASSHDDNNIQSDHSFSLSSKEHHSISSSSNPGVHLSSSIFSAKRRYPTLNFAGPLGLRTPLPRRSQRLWLTRDHRQVFLFFQGTN